VGWPPGRDQPARREGHVACSRGCIISLVGRDARGFISSPLLVTSKGGKLLSLSFFSLPRPNLMLKPSPGGGFQSRRTSPRPPPTAAPGSPPWPPRRTRPRAPQVRRPCAPCCWIGGFDFLIPPRRWVVILPCRCSNSLARRVLRAASVGIPAGAVISARALLPTSRWGALLGLPRSRLVPELRFLCSAEAS
jgi:hypothetical protein